MAYFGSEESIFAEKDYVDNTILSRGGKLKKWAARALGFGESKQFLDAAIKDQRGKMAIMVNKINPQVSHMHRGGEARQYLPTHLTQMYYEVKTNATASAMLASRSGEILRNGFEIKPKFEVKCSDCDTEYQYEAEQCQNEECSSFSLQHCPACNKTVLESDKYCPFCGNSALKNVSNMIKPDQRNKLKLEAWTDNKVNRNNQNMDNILSEIVEDWDIVDDAWIIFPKDYYSKDSEVFNTQGRAIAEIREIWRVHPSSMSFSVNANNIIGELEFTCIDHRNVAIPKQIDENGMVINSTICPECKKTLFPVIAVRYKPATENIVFRYIEGEVVHTSLYSPSALYGFPPAITLRRQLRLTSKQEAYMVGYYDKKRNPNGMLGIPAKNKNIARVFKEQTEQQLAKDEFGIPFFNFDPEKGVPIFINMDYKPKEMEFIAVRDEARQRMAALYGVSPIFQADTSAGGGLNNEGLQFTVTNRAVQKAQKVINEKILRPFVTMLNINDWILTLVPSEEQDEVAQLDIQLKKDNSAMIKAQLGFKVSLKEDGEYKFENPEDQNMEKDPFGDLLQDNPSLEEPNQSIPGKRLFTTSDLDSKQTHQYQNAPLTPDVSKPSKIKSHSSDDMNVFNEMMQKKIISNSNSNDHYSFTEEEPDWQFKDDYEIVEFREVKLSQLNLHPDFEIQEADIENESPRVRIDTLDYYMHETREMKPVLTDSNLNVFDGYHRIYVLQKRDQQIVKVGIIAPIVSEE